MYDLETHTTADHLTPEHVCKGLMEAWNGHDVDRVMSFYSPHYQGVDVGQPIPLHGLERKRDTVIGYLRAFPDMHFGVENIISQDDQVVVSWVAWGTHQGPFMHIPPTGRPVHVRGMSLLTVRRNKIARAVYVWDLAAVLREIGLLPEL